MKTFNISVWIYFSIFRVADNGMKLSVLFEDICTLIQYGVDKDFELRELVNRNYFDTTFVDQKVLKARLDVEKLLDNTLDVYDTFYEMLCDLDKKYQLVYNNGDKLYTVFKEQFMVNLYNVYYINESNIVSREFVINERLEFR